MRDTTKPLIVIIDDDLPDTYPLLKYLRKEYTPDNIFLFKKPADGVKFVEANLDKRIIVILDIMFDGKPVGFEVFKLIIEKSALVCFIIMTGNVESTSRQDLVDLINGHAWYLIQRDSPAKEIMTLIKRAQDHLSLQVDSALEEWITRQPLIDQQKIFITTREGKTYTLTDILRAIRTGEDSIGREMVGNILSLAISMLAEDQSRIGN